MDGITSKRQYFWNKIPLLNLRKYSYLNRNKTVLHLFYIAKSYGRQNSKFLQLRFHIQGQSLKNLLIKVSVRCYQIYSHFVHSLTNRLALCNNVAPVVMKFFLSYCSQISVMVFIRLRILLWIHWTRHLILFFNIFYTHS